MEDGPRKCLSLLLCLCDSIQTGTPVQNSDDAPPVQERGSRSAGYFAVGEENDEPSFKGIHQQLAVQRCNVQLAVQRCDVQLAVQGCADQLAVQRCS